MLQQEFSQSSKELTPIQHSPNKEIVPHLLIQTTFQQKTKSN